jgi:hypothetical protein
MDSKDYISNGVNCMQRLLGCTKHGSFVFDTLNVAQTIYLRLVWNSIAM